VINNNETLPVVEVINNSETLPEQASLPSVEVLNNSLSASVAQNTSLNPVEVINNSLKLENLFDQIKFQQEILNQLINPSEDSFTPPAPKIVMDLNELPNELRNDLPNELPLKNNTLQPKKKIKQYIPKLTISAQNKIKK
jgi:hypothetical protein